MPNRLLQTRRVSKTLLVSLPPHKTARHSSTPGHLNPAFRSARPLPLCPLARPLPSYDANDSPSACPAIGAEKCACASSHRFSRFSSTAVKRAGMANLWPPPCILNVASAATQATGPAAKMPTPSRPVPTAAAKSRPPRLAPQAQAWFRANPCHLPATCCAGITSEVCCQQCNSREPVPLSPALRHPEERSDEGSPLPLTPSPLPLAPPPKPCYNLCTDYPTTAAPRTQSSGKLRPETLRALRASVVQSTFSQEAQPCKPNLKNSRRAC
jgi:hypothetical protein